MHARQRFRAAVAVVLVASAALPAVLVLVTGQQEARAASPENPRFSNIVVIAMENKEISSIIDDADAPYLNSLAGKKVLFTEYYATTHPSLPNYLAIAGGSTFGVTSNSTPPIPGPTIVDQLEGAGVPWKGYMESMPSPCYLGSSYDAPDGGEYVLRHNPFLNFANVRDTAAWCNKVVPFTELADDLASGDLPAFSFITPNDCNNMHDCSVAVGDAWLAANVPPIIEGLGPDGIVIVTFDEGGSTLNGGGHIATIVAGPGAADAGIVTTTVNHYSLLRLIEDSFGLPALRGAQTASPMTGFECEAPPCLGGEPAPSPSPSTSPSPSSTPTPSPSASPPPSGPAFRPDGAIGIGRRPMVGDGIYNMDADGQTREAVTRRGRTATFRIVIGNDGEDDDDVMVRGGGDRRGLTVAYVAAGLDVTRTVRQGAYGVHLRPSEESTLRMVVTVAPGSAPVTREWLVRFMSANEVSAQDAVRARVRVSS